MRTNPQLVVLLQDKHSIVGLAKFAGAFDNGLENWSDIGGRGGNYPQDVSAPGLVGQRLGQLAGFCLNLLEQSDVADRDHRLVGEGLQQGNLFFAERMYLGAAKRDRSNALTLAQQRYAQNGAIALVAR